MRAFQLHRERLAVEVHEQLADAVLLHGVVGKAVEIKIRGDLGARMRHGRDVHDS